MPMGPFRNFRFKGVSTLLVAISILTIFLVLFVPRFGVKRSLSPHSRSLSTDDTDELAFTSPRRLQIIKAGGIPKEGLGSSLGFITAVANIAHLLDAELIMTQTATMMDYRVSEILNKGLTLRGGGRTCDIMEVLLEQPGWFGFQERMDRAQGFLDQLYDRAIARCTTEPDVPLLSEYALEEIASCDTLIINDYRVVTRDWTPCSIAWWKSVIDQYSGPSPGNVLAIHFRWGDQYETAQKKDKWRLDMNIVSRLVDIVREEDPDVVVNVFAKRSENNESETEMKELLKPLSGEFKIIEAGEDVEELSMMGKAKYLILNSGSFSIAAAATGQADVVVYNGGGARVALGSIGLNHLYDYNKLDDGDFRRSVVVSVGAK